MNTLDRFADYWTPEPNTGCFLWIGPTRRHGNIERPDPMIKKRHVNVARTVCTEHNGPAPTDKHHAAHKRYCSSMLCVNPEHLYWATPSQNNMDKPEHVRIEMGRHAVMSLPPEERKRRSQHALSFWRRK